MKSVAVLSDIHGVLPALDAVLAEPAVRAADHLDRLASPPLSVLLDVAGFGPVMFCHATARDDAEVALCGVRGVGLPGYRRMDRLLPALSGQRRRRAGRHGPQDGR